MNEDQNVTKEREVQTKAPWQQGLNKLVDDTPLEALAPIYRVVKALFLTFKMEGATTFPVPHDRFRELEIAIGNLGPVLSNLHRRGVIKVVGGYYHYPEDDPETERWVEVDIIDDRNIVGADDTRITIVPEKLGYLYKRLEVKKAFRMKETDSKKAIIDRFIANARPEIRELLSLIIDALHLERAYEGSDTFRIPYSRLNVTMDSQGDLISLLRNLVRRQIIEIWGTRTICQDPNDPQSCWDEPVSILEDSDVYHQGEAKVKVDREALDYFYLVLFGNKQAESPSALSRPKCVEKGMKGFVDFGDGSDLIEIGGISTRAYRYIRVLLNAGLGRPMIIEHVFEAIRLPKDNRNVRLSGNVPEHQRRTEMKRIIENVIGDLQKFLKGRMRFGRDEKACWLELVEVPQRLQREQEVKISDP